MSYAKFEAAMAQAVEEGIISCSISTRKRVSVAWNIHTCSRQGGTSLLKR